MRPYKASETNFGVILVCVWPITICLFLLGSTAYSQPLMVVGLVGMYGVLFLVHFGIKYYNIKEVVNTGVVN